MRFFISLSIFFLVFHSSISFADETSSNESSSSSNPCGSMFNSTGKDSSSQKNSNEISTVEYSFDGGKKFSFYQDGNFIYSAMSDIEETSTTDKGKHKVVKLIKNEYGEKAKLYDNGTIDLPRDYYKPKSFDDLVHDVIDIAFISGGIAALRKDGQALIITDRFGPIWYDSYWGIDGGYGDPPRSFFRDTVNNFKNVKYIVSNTHSVVAVKNDGTCSTFGNKYTGGKSSGISKKLVNVIGVHPVGNNSFMAVTKDKSVIIWGYDNSINKEYKRVITDVKAVYASDHAILIITNDGKIISWEDTSSLTLFDILLKLSQPNQKDNHPFLSIYEDNSFELWGEKGTGWNDYSSSVLDQLDDVVKLERTGENNFIVYKSDGSRFQLEPSFLNYSYSNILDLLKKLVFKDLEISISEQDLPISAEESDVSTDEKKVIKKISNRGNIITLYSDGKYKISTSDSNTKKDSTTVSDKLITDPDTIIKQLESANSAFVAIKEDGTKVFWGDPNESKKEDPSQSSKDSTSDDKDTSNN